MVWCVTSFNSVDGEQFTGFVSDEYESLTVNCEYILFTPKKYLEFIDVVENPVITNPPDSGQFDYAVGAEIFSFFFVTTVSLWLFAKCVGLVLKVVKDF
jgi:hypothetical protein